MKGLQKTSISAHDNPWSENFELFWMTVFEDVELPVVPADVCNPR